jgi:hypothetical protein
MHQVNPVMVDIISEARNMMSSLVEEVIGPQYVTASRSDESDGALIEPKNSPIFVTSAPNLLL